MHDCFRYDLGAFVMYLEVVVVPVATFEIRFIQARTMTHCPNCFQTNVKKFWMMWKELNRLGTATVYCEEGSRKNCNSLHNASYFPCAVQVSQNDRILVSKLDGRKLTFYASVASFCREIVKQKSIFISRHEIMIEWPFVPYLIKSDLFATIDLAGFGNLAWGLRSELKLFVE